MTERISLVEAYDNRDVIAQLVRLRDDVDELLNILKDIDPDGDLTNVVTKTGDQTIDGVKTFIGKIVADCDIIQNGSAYETHAEQVFTKNDLIVTRDDAIGGIAAGQLSGIRVKKYDGVSDLNLGVDASGIMRVGDVGDEQPLATRDEVADMISGALVKWDGVNMKMIAPASNAGTDDKPLKLVSGELVPVTISLLQDTVSAATFVTVNPSTCSGGFIKYRRMGSIVNVLFEVAIRADVTGTWTEFPLATLPKALEATVVPFAVDTATLSAGYMVLKTDGSFVVGVRAASLANANLRGSFMYFTSE